MTAGIYVVECYPDNRGHWYEAYDGNRCVFRGWGLMKPTEVDILRAEERLSLVGMYYELEQILGV